MQKISTTKLNLSNLNQEINIFGWVLDTRKLGKLIFIDLHDMYGLIQIVFNETNSNLFTIAKELKKEFVISVSGLVAKRKTPNPNLFSGEIEIIASDLKIINEAKLPPLLIQDNTDALEQVRLKYRYLDLRRPVMLNTLKVRAKLNSIIREFFLKNNFLEVETPILSTPTKGGSSEFAVKSKVHKDVKYALAQSPQIYKQLLMYSTIEKYFQIAKCFRDEDSRSDRQLEFTQLDVEMLWANEDMIMDTITLLIKEIMKQLKNIILTEIPKIGYWEAINRYGNDKPDIRFQNHIVTVNDLFINSKFDLISEKLKETKEKNVIRMMKFDFLISESQINQLKQSVLGESNNNQNLFWVVIKNGKLLFSSSNSFFDKQSDIILSLLENVKDCTFIFSIDKYLQASKVLGKIRVEIAKMFSLVDKNEFKFLWIVDWPLFELDDEQAIVSTHNPFTAVDINQQEDFKNFKITNTNLDDVLKFKARSYDLVLNGYEIGGGSIRFNKRQLQEKVFKILNFNETEVEKYFGWFLNALEYGAPFHGGIALGIDRIIAILLNFESIRDVIAFPKTSSGIDEMSQ